jgi:multisubunit Na+/H+ antiporter MnhB subunit
MLKKLIRKTNFIISLFCGILYFILAIRFYNGTSGVEDLYLKALVFYFPIFLLSFIILLIAFKLDKDEKSIFFWTNNKLMIWIGCFALIQLFPFMRQLNNDVYFFFLFSLSIAISVLVYKKIQIW